MLWINLMTILLNGAFKVRLSIELYQLALNVFHLLIFHQEFPLQCHLLISLMHLKVGQYRMMITVFG
jgi:hypothetical protein